MPGLGDVGQVNKALLAAGKASQLNEAAQVNDVGHLAPVDSVLLRLLWQTCWRRWQVASLQEHQSLSLVWLQLPDLLESVRDALILQPVTRLHLLVARQQAVLQILPQAVD